jgi:hypothetical protein
VTTIRPAPPSALVPVLAALLLAGGCGLFEPRNAADPTEPGQDFQPVPDAQTVVANLQSAVSQKSETNYMRCFADPATTPRPFTFVPSAEGVSQYGSLLTSWTRAEELNYFRNLKSRSSGSGFSDLQVSAPRTTIISADSVVYTCDYVFTFEHNDPNFPKSARGTLTFTLGPDNNGQWMIFRWIDFSAGNGITWSMFKGKFSN